jgi:hypothetical protein
MNRITPIDERQVFAVEHLTADVLASQAAAAQRDGNWRRAAAVWREAVEATDDADQRGWFERQAAWCDDMAVLVIEINDVPQRN